MSITSFPSRYLVENVSYTLEDMRATEALEKFYFCDIGEEGSESSVMKEEEYCGTLFHSW